MKTFIKRTFTAFIALALFTATSFAEGKSAIQIVNEMGAGWNLGNTLDACKEKSGEQLGLESETSWGQPKATQELIDFIANEGFSTIRIPVSWHNHYVKGKINDSWLTRVKEVVDMALKANLYVVINIHHDTYNGTGDFWGYYPSKKYEKKSIEYVKSVWTQIAAAFADYGEKLVFETLNEPRLRGYEKEWYYQSSDSKCAESMRIINKLNQIAVDTIRKSGGNNKDRLIIVTPYVASQDAVLNSDDFVIPKDPSDKLALSVHMYQPYSFAMQSPGDIEFYDGLAVVLTNFFSNLDYKFVQNGIPIFIGEFGAVNKNNAEDRIKWVECFTTESRQYGMATCLWDNGDYNVSGENYNEKFGYLNRRKLEWYDEPFIKTLLRAYK